MSAFTSLDYQMMSRAIQLAKRGKYTTAPNPNVGCVIWRDGEIVGEGFHYRAGEPHAEVHALRMAGEKAYGAVAYVTLEPCSHYGRTPPCAEGLIKSGIRKVICAMVDPNPQVAGRGLQMLREAGIEVASGLLEADAQALNPAFIKRMQTGLPYVQLKMAASLDGQTALANGNSQWITAAAARQDVQAYRAQAGAILSTSRTVIDDNASLNVRYDDLPTSVQADYPREALRQPVRVILDRQNHLDQRKDLALFQAAGEIIHVAPTGNIEPIVQQDGLLYLNALLGELAQQHGINHLWVEAGSTLASSLLKQGLVDELVIYLAPKLMGSDGRGLFGALGLEAMEQAIDLDIRDLRLVGRDLRLVAQITKKG